MAVALMMVFAKVTMSWCPLASHLQASWMVVMGSDWRWQDAKYKATMQKKQLGWWCMYKSLTNIGSTRLSVDMPKCCLAGRRKESTINNINLGTQFTWTCAVRSKWSTQRLQSQQTCPHWHMSHLIHVYVLFDFVQMSQVFCMLLNMC